METSNNVLCSGGSSIWFGNPWPIDYDISNFFYWIKVIRPLASKSAFAFCSDVDHLLEVFIFNLLQLRSKSRGQRALKVTLVRGYNLESLWLCLLQNKVEELNQRLRQVIDGNYLPFSLDWCSDAE